MIMRRLAIGLLAAFAASTTSLGAAESMAGDPQRVASRFRTDALSLGLMPVPSSRPRASR